ncbi:response regulator [Mycolicibacterium moriokaense]|uniref:Response regulator n=2 Tax=Mycolicibacterium moriokaense TaxID=39691 RepID=A0AAD1HEJ0_9MYCO|nr:response regulator [Mycolicibacterium moriokaense]
MTAGTAARQTDAMENGAEALRCVLIDDNPDFLEIAAKLLGRQGVSIVGVATNSAEALQCIEEQKPDVAIVDIKLGKESGFDLAEQIVGCPTPSPVILTSTHSGREYGELIASSPALGFVPKEQLSLEAIRRLLEG